MSGTSGPSFGDIGEGRASFGEPLETQFGGFTEVDPNTATPDQPGVVFDPDSFFDLYDVTKDFNKELIGGIPTNIFDKVELRDTTPLSPEEDPGPKRELSFLDRIGRRVESVVTNPITTLINIGFSKVPVLGQLNSLSSIFGGPTVGEALTAAGRALAAGDITQTPQEFAGISNEIIGRETAYDTVEKKYRLKDGRIVTFTEYVPVKFEPVTYDPFEGSNGASPR